MKELRSLTSRRTFLMGLSILASGSACTAVPRAGKEPDPNDIFARVEALRGGRIGVFAKDLETGAVLVHRGDERFAMCSTFKWILAGLILARANAHREMLERTVSVTETEIVSHSPFTREHAGSKLSVRRLCEAAITVSDNTAANLLLKSMGGPDGFTEMLRRLGDRTTRLDRYETALNEAAADDPRDTTTPAAMVNLLDMFLTGDVLSTSSRDILRGWMLATRNGNARLPAGAGPEWAVGHKPGTNNRNMNNSVGFFEHRSNGDRTPILIASFSDGPDPTASSSDAAHALVAKLAFEHFTAVPNRVG